MLFYAVSISCFLAIEKYKKIVAGYSEKLWQKVIKDSYMHHFKSVSDTGAKMNLLQEFYFISLDIFKKSLHNNGITSDLEAWLTFLCEDELKYIVQLIKDYPQFKSFYEEAYRLCLNVEDIMGLFSEELRMA